MAVIKDNDAKIEALAADILKNMKKSEKIDRLILAHPRLEKPIKFIGALTTAVGVGGGFIFPDKFGIEPDANGIQLVLAALDKVAAQHDGFRKFRSNLDNMLGGDDMRERDPKQYLQHLTNGWDNRNSVKKVSAPAQMLLNISGGDEGAHGR